MKEKRTMEDLYKSLISAKNQYDGAISKIEGALSAKVKFPFAIFYQQSDGFVVLHTEEMHNAPLIECLLIIKKKGKLTYKDYIEECI